MWSRYLARSCSAGIGMQLGTAAMVLGSRWAHGLFIYMAWAPHPWGSSHLGDFGVFVVGECKYGEDIK